MESSNLSKEQIYINSLKLKLKNFDDERKRIKEFNINARKNNLKSIEYKILHNISTKANRLRRKIEMLESWKYLENKKYEINNVKIIENYKIRHLEFHFKEQPEYKIIKQLVAKDFEYNNKGNYWFIELNEKSLKYLRIIES